MQITTAGEAAAAYAVAEFAKGCAIAAVALVAAADQLRNSSQTLEEHEVLDTASDHVNAAMQRTRDWLLREGLPSNNGLLVARALRDLATEIVSLCDEVEMTG